MRARACAACHGEKGPLDPLMPWWQHAIALGHFVLGRYEEASSWAAMRLQAAPDNHALLRISAASNALAGRLVQTRKAVGRVLINACVCFEAQTGKHLLGLSLTTFDPSATSRRS